MLGELVLLLAITPGQCCYYQSVPSVAKCETHYLKNTGTVYQKFYVKIELPNGHETSVPVINGKLPQITYYTNNNQVTDVVCDYSCGRDYSDYRGAEIVRYITVSQYGGRSKAPAPHHPDYGRGVGRSEHNRGSSKAPAPGIPDIIDQLKSYQRNVEKYPGSMKKPSDVQKVPSPVHPGLPSYGIK
jgi:hypothetical protein